MSSTTMWSETPVEHIGPAHHRARNAGIAFTILALIATMIGFYAYSARHSANAMDRLAAFQAAYAEHCNARYAADTSRMVRHFYADSSQMQDVVSAQLRALQDGASCDTVARALRAADYPLPLGAEQAAQ